MLVSPGVYHEKLARADGFYSLGTGKRKVAKLRRLLFTRNGLNDSFLRKLGMRCTALADRHRLSRKPEKSLADLIDGCAPVVSRACTVCGAPYQGNVIGRFHERTYCRCPACGIINMNRLAPPPVEYGREYFFELYKRQYGKTYIEDFPNLVKMAAQRLARIKKLRAGKKSGATDRVLDIGCAYGPFLTAAREAGFSPFGVDPAEDAVRYVQEKLGVPAIHGSFPGCDFREFNIREDGAALFEVVTLWYVIEHFTDCAAALAEIKKILKPGGILAFSTPTFSGVSGRSSLKCFLENSPPDHWTIWSPHTCTKALKRAGFTVKKIVSTGHHPERFPVLGRFAGSKQSPLYGILAAVSKLFSLGDTFEVYAVKQWSK
jgi:2-polyprenyl-3-methyl-5-hydroxy-6-metoxy-1,4-benzoquinol methylase